MGDLLHVHENVLLDVSNITPLSALTRVPVFLKFIESLLGKQGASGNRGYLDGRRRGLSSKHL
jgi:hypothetical protein